jgi:hypothetical protein
MAQPVKFLYDKATLFANLPKTKRELSEKNQAELSGTVSRLPAITLA